MDRSDNVSYSNMMQTGIDNVYKYDLESQKQFITTICNDVRDMNPSAVFNAKGFFVPNNEYLINFFGSEIASDEYDFYDYSGTCLWDGKLILPVFNLVNEVVGCTAFDPFRYLQAHEEQDWSLNYYSYSTKKVFTKGSYLYCLPDTYVKALREGYLIITDGVFDTLSVSQYGFLAAAMLGSVVTEEIAAQLRFIKLIIVAMDNDDAGLQLVNRLKKLHDNVVFLKQGITKDADDILKSEHRERYLASIRNLIASDVPMDTVVSYGNSKLKNAVMFNK